MAPSELTREQQIQQDVRDLHRLGYAQPRVWYAFARDDGMRASGLIKQVSPTSRTPVYSTIITSVLAVLICLYAAAFYVVTSIGTITLYLAYMFPIYLNWRNKRRGQGEFTTPETAPWSLGKLVAKRSFVGPTKSDEAALRRLEEPFVKGAA